MSTASAADSAPAGRFRNLIGAEWQGSAQVMPDVNPSDTRDVVGEFPTASADTVAAAVACARKALPGWAHASPQVRANVLDAAAREVAERQEELALLLAREAGKTLPEARGEVGRAAQILRYFAGEPLRLRGYTGDSIRPGVRVEVRRHPVGVVGLITPWNFPIAIPAWKIAPALAYGNTVVLKPSELAPGSAWMLVDILRRAGAPAGVVNLVFGPGNPTGQALVENADVNALSFTGSSAVGKAIGARAVARGCRVQLEMGGKNPLLVMDDADLDLAVECAANGAFFSAGQRCTASSRLIVTDGIHDRFVQALSRRLAGLRVGNALSEGTNIGPLIDGKALEKALSYIELSRQAGVEPVCGGSRIESATPGYYLSPTLFAQTSNAMRLNREEVFAPVAAVIRVNGYEEALQVANDTEYGLSAGICTKSLSIAEHFRTHVEAGVTMVNLPTAGLDFHVPFGGIKASSMGPREQGFTAYEFYTASRTAYIAAGAPV